MFDKLKELMLRVCGSVNHRYAAETKPPYIVWNQTNALFQDGDDRSPYIGWRVAVDYFTIKEYDDTPLKLISLLQANQIVVSDYVTDYERDTGVTHHALTVEVYD